LDSSKIWIGFESTVEQDQEFSHGGSESKLGWFTGSTQSQIKGAQGWIVPGSD